MKLGIQFFKNLWVKKSAASLPMVETRTVVYDIGRDAKLLGVSRYHLGEVLKGRRHSPGLIKRYEDLKRTQRCA